MASKHPKASIYFCSGIIPEANFLEDYYQRGKGLTSNMLELTLWPPSFRKGHCLASGGSYDADELLFARFGPSRHMRRLSGDMSSRKQTEVMRPDLIVSES